MYYPEGILSSMVTCFDEKGNVNLERLGETIEFQKISIFYFFELEI